LTESSLTELLEIAARQFKEIDLTVAAGVPQLTFEGGAEKAGTKLLQRHYQELAGSIRPLKNELLCGPFGSIADDSFQLAGFMGATK
jgi:hypothetical protein